MHILHIPGQRYIKRSGYSTSPHLPHYIAVGGLVVLLGNSRFHQLIIDVQTNVKGFSAPNHSGRFFPCTPDFQLRVQKNASR